MVNSNEPENWQKGVFFNVTKEAGPDNTQGCNFLNVVVVVISQVRVFC